MQSTPALSFRVRAAFVVLIVGALTYLNREYHLDDALIYARYIRNALEGHGLVFNVGEPVNALTSILYAWLLLGVSWLLHGRVLLAEALLSGTFLCVAALLAEWAVPMAGLAVAASSFFYFCNGMETSLFLALLMLCVQAYRAGRVAWLPTLCALAVLTRFEGGALALAIGWRLWQERRLPRLMSYLPVAVLGALYFASNLHNYGVLLPQSAAAKFGQGMAGFWGRWPTAFLRVPPTVYLPAFGSWVFVPLAVVLVYFAVKTERAPAMNRVVVPFLLGLAAFCILLNIPNYFWYYAPFLYFAYVYVALLLPQVKRVQWAALLLLLCLAQASATRILTDAHIWKDYVAAATWMEAHLPADAVVATAETGNIGWYGKRRTLDMVGLTTPHNAAYTRHRDFASWLQDRPDYVVTHPTQPFPWEKAALASAAYAPVGPQFGSVMLLRRTGAK